MLFFVHFYFPFFVHSYFIINIEVMLKKHPTCRWRSEKVKSRKYFILAEGYAWLTQVYFQKEKSLTDADIDFFEDSIGPYEELLKVEH